MGGGIARVTSIECTTTTSASRRGACSTAHASATAAPSDPSIPTTIVRVLMTPAAPSWVQSRARGGPGPGAGGPTGRDQGPEIGAGGPSRVAAVAGEDGPMRVMLVGTTPGAIDRTEEVLASGGHEVVHCRDEHAGTFPCTALTERGSCPFEVAPVDVVVTARDRAWPKPAPLEDGATCGIHRFVPLVVHGTTALEPFDRWAVAETATDAELLDAVERAAGAPLPEHGAVATATDAGPAPESGDHRGHQHRGGPPLRRTTGGDAAAHAGGGTVRGRHHGEDPHRAPWPRPVRRRDRRRPRLTRLSRLVTRSVSRPEEAAW